MGALYGVIRHMFDLGFNIIPPTVLMAIMPFAAAIVIVKVVKSL